MILLAILFLILFMSLVIFIGLVSVGGTLAIVMFGDIIICCYLIVKIIMKILNKEKND